MACKYVKDFEFGKDKGYTGSAGQIHVKGYVRGGRVEAKINTVMHEFGQGKLHSGGNGAIVKNPKQAIAIAYSEARKANKK